MSPINRITRESVINGHRYIERSVPVDEFDAILLPGETLEVITHDELEQRVAAAFEPYTFPGSDTQPRISLVPFNIETSDDTSVTMHSAKVTGDLYHLHTYLCEDASDLPALDEHVVALQGLTKRLFEKTSSLASAPGSLLWYEATPSQFSYLPPGKIALVDSQPVEGGPAGMFFLLDIDPRFVTVTSGTSNNEVFFDKLDRQFMALTGESAELGVLAHKSNTNMLPRDDIIALQGFQEHCPLSHELMELVLSAA